MQTPVGPAARVPDPLPFRADAHLPELSEILITHVEVLEHVPKGLRVMWATVLTELINDFCYKPRPS